jgi:hypothetical protein
MRFPCFRGPAAVLLGALTVLGMPPLLHADDQEAVAPHGIELLWQGSPVPAESFYAELAEPLLTLRLINHDRTSYTLTARTLEDAGSLQTRRTGVPATATLAAAGTGTVAIRLGGAGLTGLTHSGMVTVVVQACPTQGGPCVPGTPYPLFFHGSGGRVLVYGEKVLCSRFRCGDLYGTSEIEPGTWRVQGGGPLHGVNTNEETPVGGVQ